MSCMIVRLSLLLALLCCAPALAQQNVRVRVDNAGTKLDLPAQLFRPAATAASPPSRSFMAAAVRARTPRAWPGFCATGVTSPWSSTASPRAASPMCAAATGRAQADAEKRAGDIDAALQWLAGQNFVDPKRLAFMGYSYGGGVAMLRALSPQAADAAPIARAAILVYPDCALADALGPKLAVRQPTLFAMGALDDWTPVSQCQAVIGRVVQGRDLVETRIYEGAHHSFDALGLPVRYLPGVGNRSKPGGCCGAHYGANEAAWKAFVTDVKAFLARVFAT